MARRTHGMRRRAKKPLRFPLTAEQRRSDDWNPLWDTLAEWDPAFVEAYIRFRSAPRRPGGLSPVMRELILIAVNACTTHLYAPGVRRHIQNALRLGASRRQILEAIQTTTLVGIHSCNLAVPILAEELKTARRQARERS